MMRLLGTDAKSIEIAGRALLDGDIVAFPTETVYGLGAVATNDRSVARIFACKDRPSYNPLIAHVADIEAARIFADFDERAEQLAKFFLPGPLTIVLRLKIHSAISRMVTAGLDTIAVRVPAHPVAQAILQHVELPVAAPSANASCMLSPTRAEHVQNSLGESPDYLVDGGPTSVGLESTVVDLSDAAQPGILLRPGSLPRSEIENVIGPLGEVDRKLSIKAPGMLAKHYSPTKPLRLNARSAKRGEAMLNFGPQSIGGEQALNLSVSGDLSEAAANLYDMLWHLDMSESQRIAVAPIPKTGIGEAINDRLRKAAAPTSLSSSRAPAS